MTVPSKNTQNPPIGRLIMAANAIGNTRDIPARSLLAVQQADLLIFEEDRGARLVLKTAGIHREYWRYSEHRQEETIDKLRDTLNQGKTAVYMSDQGLPVLEDPGAALLELAYSMGAKVQIVPGPSSIFSSLSACPFITHHFYFAGYLPREDVARELRLRELKNLKCPLVVLDTPYRLQKLIQSCISVFGPNSNALLSMDISGVYEHFEYGKLSKIELFVSTLEEKQNFVLILKNS